jgi:hypothetical protein
LLRSGKGNDEQKCPNREQPFELRDEGIHALFDSNPTATTLESPHLKCQV